MVVGSFHTGFRLAHEHHQANRTETQAPHLGLGSPLRSHSQKGVQLNGGLYSRVVCEGGHPI